MADKNFEATVTSLFKGMNNFMATKTVVGEAVSVGDMTMVPLVDVSFGMAAGAAGEDRKQRGNGGMGGKMTPSAMLVIKNGNVRLVNIKNQDVATRLLDLVPQVLERFKNGGDSDSDIEDAVDEALKKAESEA